MVCGISAWVEEEKLFAGKWKFKLNNKIIGKEGLEKLGRTGVEQWGLQEKGKNRQGVSVRVSV